jgi:hypothetical protein
MYIYECMDEPFFIIVLILCMLNKFHELYAQAHIHVSTLPVEFKKSLGKTFGGFFVTVISSGFLRRMTMCSISKIHSTPATAGMPELVEMPATVLASAGTAHSTIWTPTTQEFSRKFTKKSSERRKNSEERRKKD